MALPVRHRRSVPAQGRAYAGWDPFREIDDLFSRMTNLFDQVAPDMSTGDRAWVPIVEAGEDEAGYTVKAELPGFKRDDVTVDVHDRALVIKGDSADDPESGATPEGRLSHRSGSFYYRASLPADVDAAQVKATMRDGVLSVRLPRGPKEKSHKVQITEG